MPRGGFRPCSGRPKKEKSVKETVPSDIRFVAKALKLSPLEYMLLVMNDESAEDLRRDRMAVAAAPYVHSKMGEASAGKREQAIATAEDRMADGGRYSAPSPPPGIQ